MDSAFLISLSVFIFALISFGFLLNGFIFIKNITEWFQGNQLHAIDLIMASLGLIRIFLLMVYVLTTSVFISAELYNLTKLDFDYIIIPQGFVEFYSLWWGTVLCVFYCVKITNYSNRLFIKLKMRISHMVPWLLLGSMIMSCLSCFPYFWLKFLLPKIRSNQSYNGTNHESITLSSHVVSFLQLKNLYFIFICYMFVVAYPRMHSVVLIISNVKLKQSIINVLHCLK
ncbi:taste receptor type 2 member 3-like [Pyxicephalus adspersus]|uniref:taste receptor type 2 member 3-like n=1 Tax=Pyxicephalus adspersus TaxID=30357 RepID=UPI003B5A4319